MRRQHHAQQHALISPHRTSCELDPVLSLLRQDIPVYRDNVPPVEAQAKLLGVYLPTTIT